MSAPYSFRRVAGLIPGLFSYGGITPLYLVKTHQQISAGQSGPPLYSSTLHGKLQTVKNKKKLRLTRSAAGLTTICRQGGIRYLYRGVISLMLRGGMLSSGQTLGYDLCKSEAKKRQLLEDGPILHLCASLSSAATATIFGMPCDCVFTQYSSASSHGKEYRNVFHCAACLLREQGGLAFYRGSTAFFFRSAPIFTLYFPIYEQTRKYLGLGFLS